MSSKGNISKEKQRKQARKQQAQADAQLLDALLANARKSPQKSSILKPAEAASLAMRPLLTNYLVSVHTKEYKKQLDAKKL